MFTDCNLFGMISGDEGVEIRRIKVNRDTQIRVNQHFSSIIENSNILQKERKLFDGRYKPDNSEVLVIEGYNIDNEFTNAVQRPITENTLDRVEIDVPNLKAVFIGDIIDGEMVIAIQLIQKSQHLTSDGVSLFQQRGTFKTVGENGFTLLNKVDAVYVGNDLIFQSYYFARQIFDLSDYYRIATDQDVETFVDEYPIEVEERGAFIENADSWVRRKIALIKDSRVLELNTVSDISQIAGEYNVEIQTTLVDGADKIVLPNDKMDLKEVLKFLDEDIYKGPLTNQMFETNSKLAKN